MISFELRDGRYSARLGGLLISQSTFMVLVAILAGLGGGFGAVAFRALIDGEGTLAFDGVGGFLSRYIGPVGIVDQLALGGTIAAFVASRFAPEAKGHGVPEVMEAVALRGGLMRPRVIAVKAVASATSIGFGGSRGREGPIVQIGSAVGSVIGADGKGSEPVDSIVLPFADRLIPNDSVERAATLMADDDTPLLAVEDPNSDTLVGIVTRRDVLHAYRSVTDA